jgi:hypothetical protein
MLFLLSFAIRQFNPVVPQTWDMDQLKSMHLPYADSSVKLEFVSEEYYRRIPVRISYKTYPFYMPGYEPKGYYDSLANIDPIVNFKEEDLKTEEDWIKAGELIYELPMNYIPLDAVLKNNL